MAAYARPTLWVVSELYAPELTSTGYFITRIAEHLAHDPSRRVAALASQPTYSARGVRAADDEIANGVHVRRYWSPALAKDSLGGKLANLVAFTLQCAWGLFRGVSSGDIILSVTNPPPLPYVAAFIARLRRARFVVLVHDMYPEVILAGGMAKPTGLLVRTLERASRWLYHTADRVIVLGRDMQKLVAAKLPPGDAWRVAIIPNWASLDEVHATAPRPRQENMPFVVQHAGNMGRGHNIEILARAAKRLSNVRFTFVGDGAKRGWIEREAARNSLANVRVMGYRPRSELSNSLGDCDVAAISFVRGMSGVSVPSRMYNVLAAGRPIIAVCDDDSELALVVTEETIGWVVAPDDLEGLVSALSEAAQSPELVLERGRTARRVAEERYSEEIIMQSYDELISSLECSH